MNNKLTIVFVVFLLSATMSAPAVAQEIETRDAELNVRMPSYIEGSVEEQTVDGQNLYIAKGEQVDVAPANFDSSQVVDFGVSTPGGSMSYDSDFRMYQFSPEGNSGTFEVFWIVSERQSVNSSQNETQRVQVRYEALIRITGGTNFVHISETEQEDREYFRNLGDDVNGSIEELRDRDLPLAKNTGSDEEIMNAMIRRYINTGDPWAMLTGNYTQILTLIILTLGGLLLAAQYLGLLAFLVRSFRKRLNIHESIESVEGEIADRQASVDAKEARRIMQKLNWNDIFENDHISHAFRESFGETPFDGYQRLVQTQLLPEVWVRDRLLAMGEVGWKVDGTIGQENLESAELVPPSDNSDDLMEIEEAIDRGLLDVIDWDSPEIRDFDLVESDFDSSNIAVTPKTYDLSDLVEELDIQMRHFENEQTAGQYLLEYIESVRNHNYTDDDGRPRTSRDILNHWLQLSQVLGDRYQFPETHYIRQSIERALIDFDPSESAKNYVEEVSSGRLA